MSDQDSPTTIELLTFQLAGQEYSLDIMSVREIRSWTRATPLPHAPARVVHRAIGVGLKPRADVTPR